MVSTSSSTPSRSCQRSGVRQRTDRCAFHRRSRDAAVLHGQRSPDQRSGGRRCRRAGLGRQEPDGLRASPAFTRRQQSRAAVPVQRHAGTPARGFTAGGGTVYTSYFACDWMVCLQDAPGDKAHLALDLFLPTGVTSVGAGRMMPRLAASSGLVLHCWRSTRPYSPYLYGFAAGPLVRRSERTSTGEFVYLDGTGTKADLATLFAQTPAMAAFFAGKAGLPLPNGRYVQVLVPGVEAQEAATFSLIGKDELDSDRNDPSSAWVIAHEMAHQWWGIWSHARPGKTSG